MTAGTPPNYFSLLSMPTQQNNFIAIQSAQLTVSNSGSAGSRSVTFTQIPGTGRVTAKICNTGTKTAYLCGSNSSLIIPAVASSSTPLPTATMSTAVCDAIPGGAILQQDFVQGVDTISAICGGSDTTTLEISFGSGQ